MAVNPTWVNLKEAETAKYYTTSQVVEMGGGEDPLHVTSTKYITIQMVIQNFVISSI